MRLIDVHHLGRAGIICPGLAGTQELTLLDCGPASSFENSLAELRRLGFQPEQVSRVLLTHIHLDHAGAAWRWATEFGATICVHPRGHAHLVDPTKLIASARRVFGAQLERLWGELRPVPADRVKVLEDGEWVGRPHGVCLLHVTVTRAIRRRAGPALDPCAASLQCRNSARRTASDSRGNRHDLAALAVANRSGR